MKTTILLLSTFIFLLLSCNQNQEAQANDTPISEKKVDYEAINQKADIKVLENELLEAKKLYIEIFDATPNTDLGASSKLKIDSIDLVFDKIIEEAPKMFRINIDDINNINFYKPKNSPKNLSKNSLYCYLGETKSGHIYLRYVIQYFADSWLFIDKFTVKADDDVFEITDKVKRDATGWNITEWLDAEPGARELRMLKSLAYGDNCKVRMHGENYYYDYTLSKQDKEDIRSVLMLYQALKNQKGN